MAAREGRGEAVDPRRGVQGGEDGRAVSRLFVGFVRDPDGEHWLTDRREAQSDR